MIAAVLEHYGADLTRVREYGWQDLRCPFAENHSHSDRNKSGRVNLELGAYICHACGAKGNAINLVKWKEGLDTNAAIELLEGITGQKVTGVRRTTKDDTPRPVSRWREALFPGARD